MVTGPFWTLMKLMDGPLRVFDIYRWSPIAYEAYGRPLWSKIGHFWAKRLKKQLSGNRPLLAAYEAYGWPPSRFWHIWMAPLRLWSLWKAPSLFLKHMDVPFGQKVYFDICSLYYIHICSVCFIYISSVCPKSKKSLLSQS